MSPSSAVKDVSSMHFRYPEVMGNHFCGVFTRHIERSHFADLIPSQFAPRMILAAKTLALFNSIGSVVKRCANKKMLRVYALSIVALMANKKSFWNWSVFHFPRKAMRPKLGPAMAYGEYSISIGVNCCRPLPALARLIDFIPKSYAWIGGFSCHKEIIACA